MVVLMMDATQEISDQDAHIAGFAIDAGRALVVAVNKWMRLTSIDANGSSWTFRANSISWVLPRCITFPRSRGRVSPRY